MFETKATFEEYISILNSEVEDALERVAPPLGGFLVMEWDRLPKLLQSTFSVGGDEDNLVFCDKSTLDSNIGIPYWIEKIGSSDPTVFEVGQFIVWVYDH